MINIINSLINFFRSFIFYYLLLVIISIAIHIIPGYISPKGKEAISFYRTQKLNKYLHTIEKSSSKSYKYYRLVALNSILKIFSKGDDDFYQSKKASDTYKRVGIMFFLYLFKYILLMLILGKMMIIYVRGSDNVVSEQIKYSTKYTFSDILYFIQGKRKVIFFILFLMDLLYFILKSLFEHYIFMNSSSILSNAAYAMKLQKYLSFHLFGLWLYILFIYSLVSALVDDLRLSSIFKHGIIVLLKYPTENIIILFILFANWIIMPGIFFLFSINPVEHGMEAIFKQNYTECLFIVLHTFLLLIAFGAIFNLIVYKQARNEKELPLMK